MSRGGINIILYPRSYNKRGDVGLHSVQGVTDDGVEINVKLRLDEEPSDPLRAPSIAEFSREDRKAKQACIATPDNGPQSREGVLLFNRAYSEGLNSKKIESFVAKWASVLASDSDSPDPIIGIGRMEIRTSSPAIEKLKVRLEKAKASGNLEEVEKIEEQISNPENFSYPVIMYYPKELVSVPSNDLKSFRHHACKMLEKHGKHGVMGGFMVRLVNAQERIIQSSYYEFLTRYISGDQRYQTPSEAVDYFVERQGGRYFDKDDLTLEIMPIKRINCGPRGNHYYGDPKRLKLTNRLYYDDNHEPMVCNVAARVTVFDDTDTTLLSRLYSLSAPLGHPIRLDSEGGLTRLLDDEKAKLAQMDVSADDLVEREIGLVSGFMIQRADWVITGNKPPMISPPSDKGTEQVESGQLNQTVFDKEDVTPEREDQGGTEYVTTSNDSSNSKSSVASSAGRKSDKSGEDNSITSLEQTDRDSFALEDSERASDGTEESGKSDYSREEDDSSPNSVRVTDSTTNPPGKLTGMAAFIKNRGG